ncbi:MAG: N-acyl-D-amino-acid deacylase family protein [Candidatus Acetothermia bacterium]
MTLDYLLKDGRIVDGKGNQWYRGDLAVKDGKIEEVGGSIAGQARETVELEDRFVCPGFIDPHSHSDFVFFVDSTAQSKVRQGVTTEVVGNCGMSGAPFQGAAKDKLKASSFAYGLDPDWEGFGEFLEALRKVDKTVNLAPLVGHGTLRAAVVGMEDRPATSSELATMEEILDQALLQGAVGLSTGLYFPPGNYATQEELIALGKIVADRYGVLTSHIRDEGSKSIGFIPAVEEILEIATQAQVPLQISHIKAFGPDVWGTSKEVLQLVEDARDRGVDATFDQYPYTATGGGIANDTLPASFQRGKTSDEIAEELKRPDVRAEVRPAVEANVRKRGGAENQTIANFPADQSYEGKTLHEISQEQGKDPADVVLDMIAEGRTAGNWISWALNEDDVIRFMKYPGTMVCSDGASLSISGPLSEGNPHPRNFGAFPRVISTYVNEGVLELEEAIRKMTSLTAQRFGLHDRGTLESGNWADIVVLEEEVSAAPFEKPKTYPEGIPYVMVNGEWVIEEGQFVGTLPGRLSRRK